MAHFIMTIQDLNKVHDKKVVIERITLAFYHGAKIGVVGGNGAGKSTLLRIMAGEDTDFDGLLHHNPGTRIGHVPQEPLLDADKTVREIVEEGVASQLDRQAQRRSIRVNLDVAQGAALRPVRSLSPPEKPAR